MHLSSKPVRSQPTLRTLDAPGQAPITIRHAHQADAPTIIDMMGKILRLHMHWGEDPDTQAEFEPNAWVNKHLGQTDHLFLVAELQQQVVGYIEGRRRVALPQQPTGWRRWMPRQLWRRWRYPSPTLRLGHRSGLVLSVYVVRAQRVRRVADALMETLENEMRKLGIQRLEASILNENHPSQAYVQRLGFRRYRVHMLKELSAGAAE